MKTSIINGSEVSRLSVAIHYSLIWVKENINTISEINWLDIKDNL